MSINFILTVCIHNLNAIFSTNTYLFVNRKKQTLVYACTLLIQEVVGIDHHLKVLFYNDYLYNECFVSP